MKQTTALLVSSTLALALALTACNGRLGQFVPGVTHDASSTDGTTTVTVKITVATKSPTVEKSLREPQYFSRSSRGLLIRAYEHGKAKLIGEVAVNISPGAKACKGSVAYHRKCSATLLLAPGERDDFVLYVYNQKPRNDKIPHKARLLGYGRLAGQKISSTKANEFSVYIRGVIAGLSTDQDFMSLPADGSAHALALLIDPTDFGNHPITAGKNDPFANPIVLSLAETGGSGHASLSLNGGAPSTEVRLRYSTDTASLSYDGGGSAGYGIALTARAPKFKKSAAADLRLQVSPLFVTARSLTGTTLKLFPGMLPTLAVSELLAPGTQTYAVHSGTGCASIATVGEVSGGGASATAVVTAGPLLSAGGCTIAVSDGSAMLELSATNTPASISVVAPAAVTFDEYPIPSALPYPDGIVSGPDGALWFTEAGTANKIGRIPTNATPGSGAQIGEFPIPTAFSHAAGIAAGQDGALWFAECAGRIARIPTDATPGSGAQIAEYPSSPNNNPFGLAVALNGSIWYGDGLSNSVTNMSTAGANGISKATTQKSALFFTVGPDGAIWFTEGDHPSYIARINASGNLTETAVTTTLPNNPSPQSIAVGSDGNLWFTDGFPNYAIGKAVVQNGAIASFTEIPLPSGGYPQGIVAGPDGALWFTDFAKSAIGRIPTNATTTADIKEYSLPSSGDGPLWIANGSDGALWFTEYFTGKVGRLTLPTFVITAHPRNFRTERAGLGYNRK